MHNSCLLVVVGAVCDKYVAVWQVCLVYIYVYILPLVCIYNTIAALKFDVAVNFDKYLASKFVSSVCFGCYLAAGCASARKGSAVGGGSQSLLHKV